MGQFQNKESVNMDFYFHTDPDQGKREEKAKAMVGSRGRELERVAASNRGDWAGSVRFMIPIPKSFFSTLSQSMKNGSPGDPGELAQRKLNTSFLPVLDHDSSRITEQRSLSIHSIQGTSYGTL